MSKKDERERYARRLKEGIVRASDVDQALKDIEASKAKKQRNK